MSRIVVIDRVTRRENSHMVAFVEEFLRESRKHTMEFRKYFDVPMRLFVLLGCLDGRDGHDPDEICMKDAKCS